MHATPHEVPPWVFRLFNDKSHRLQWRVTATRERVRILENADWRLVSLHLEDAIELDQKSFQDLCERAYHQLWESLNEIGDSWHVVRWWNFIPRILEPLGEVEHRYMAFNAGRHRALECRLREIPRVATASGVGHFGKDLWLHGLAARHAGHAVENPRQVPAYRYSRRFGPIPPCFARATRIPASGQAGVNAPWLLVGGTASVRGEDSLHRGQPAGQLDETLCNLAAVTRAGFCCKDPTAHADEALATFRNLRVYLVDPTLQPTVADALDRHFPNDVAVEYLHADLCRPELLVEIEGVADLSRRPLASGSLPEPAALAHLSP